MKLYGDNYRVLTKNSNNYDFKDNSGNAVKGVSYKLGFVQGMNIGEIKCNEEVFNNIKLDAVYKLEFEVSGTGPNYRLSCTNFSAMK